MALKRPKSDEGNKLNVENICTRVTKHASIKLGEAEVNLN